MSHASARASARRTYPAATIPTLPEALPPPIRRLLVVFRALATAGEPGGSSSVIGGGRGSAWDAATRTPGDDKSAPWREILTSLEADIWRLARRYDGRMRAADEPAAPTGWRCGCGKRGADEWRSCPFCGRERPEAPQASTRAKTPPAEAEGVFAL